MAPKGKAKGKKEEVSLTVVEFTEEELSDAKVALKSMSGSQQTSKMASMVYFLKTNPHAAAAESRGTVRQDYLLKFMAHQMKAKKATKTQDVIMGVESRKGKGKVWNWWSLEKMEKELG